MVNTLTWSSLYVNLMHSNENFKMDLVCFSPFYFTYITVTMVYKHKFHPKHSVLDCFFILLAVFDVSERGFPSDSYFRCTALGFWAQKPTPSKQTNLFGNSSQSDESGLERQGGIKGREGKKNIKSQRIKIWSWNWPRTKHHKLIIFN